MEQIKQILLGETYWHLKKLMDNLNRNQSTGSPPLLYPNINVKKIWVFIHLKEEIDFSNNFIHLIQELPLLNLLCF
jgi:hypothetical protein